MTCTHCCGADKIFDKKGTLKQLKSYRKKGPRKTSRLLIEGITEKLNGSTTLLDIGGGIGAVHLELLKKGLMSVTDIDASSEYIKLATEESVRQGFEDNLTFIHGDFVDHANEVNKHDIVVLDKVLCCYPNLDQLVNLSLAKSNSLYAVVYPKNNFLGRLIISFGNALFYLKRNPFRVFLHSNLLIRSMMEDAGFKQYYHKTVYPWNVEVYERVKTI